MLPALGKLESDPKKTTTCFGLVYICWTLGRQMAYQHHGVCGGLVEVVVVFSIH